MSTEISESKVGVAVVLTEELGLPSYNDYLSALDVQTACNLSGIVHSFSRVITKIWREANYVGYGTDYVNHHPICRAFTEQIAWLSGGSGTVDTYTDYAKSKYLKAMHYCWLMAARLAPTTEAREKMDCYYASYRPDWIRPLQTIERNCTPTRFWNHH